MRAIVIPRRAAAAVAILSLVTAACGGDEDPAESDTTAASADEDTGAPADTEATITIADFAFTGATEVPVGTTVVVTNTDGASHTWSSVTGAFNSGPLEEGDSFEFTFTDPGEYAYLCNFHPSMQGTIVVTP